MLSLKIIFLLVGILNQLVEHFKPQSFEMRYIWSRKKNKKVLKPIYRFSFEFKLTGLKILMEK